MSPRMLTVGFLSPLFAGLLAFAEMTPGYSPEADGRWWLSQSPAVRQQFVRGWTDGYINGWYSAQARLIAVMEEAREVVPPEQKLVAALLVSLTVLQEANPDYGKPPAHYAEQVTTFYTRYADLRECPVGLVLKGLDDRGRLTLDAIARWLREHWLR